MRGRRLPVIDEFVEGDEAVVLVGATVVGLSPLASSVLHAIGAGWTEVDVVVGVVLAQYGSPGDGLDPTDVVKRTVGDLARYGLVELDEPTRA